MVATVAKKLDASTFGVRLRAIRLERKLTQEQLGERVDMRSQNIARLESGGRVPRWDTVVDLARALGVEPNDFLDDSGG